MIVDLDILDKILFSILLILLMPWSIEGWILAIRKIVNSVRVKTKNDAICRNDVKEIIHDELANVRI